MYSKIIKEHKDKFNELPTFFEGHSRILKTIDDNFLLCKLKPTLFSIQKNGPVEVKGIDKVRIRLNELLCNHLHQHGVATSTLWTEDDLILMKKETVPPIEVVVKSSFVGSPKHIYKHLDKIITRHGGYVAVGKEHNPYVRFDWRNPLPDSDQCMPQGLADHFINTKTAEETAIKAFKILRSYLQKFQLDLIDICYFMNMDGNVLCAEISTDNTRIVYTGKDPRIIELFTSKEKSDAALERAKIVLQLIDTTH